jgi:hypothetical protein
MALYSPEQLLQRKAILQTQKLLWEFLDSESINKLVDLFSTRNIKSKSKIENYIEKEWNKQGLDTTNITIDGKFYGLDKNDPTLLIDILKNNNKILHLSIHLSVKDLEPKDTGIIHIYKNIYKTINPKLSPRRKLYALIAVQQPPEKPNSLVFAIADGYTTPSGIQDKNIYDPELQKEMDVILTVLNRLFDEEDEYYIGNKDKYVNYHNTTSPVLENMNKYTEHVTRKNRGNGIIPFLKNGFHSVIRRRPYQKTPRKRNSKRITRKKFKNRIIM